MERSVNDALADLYAGVNHAPEFCRDQTVPRPGQKTVPAPGSACVILPFPLPGHAQPESEDDRGKTA